MITRSNAEALIPESVSNEIFQEAPKSSLVMQAGRQLADIPRKDHRMPVLSGLAHAGWVQPSDTGQKAVSSSEWANVFIKAEELAVIIPIPESVLDDADYDIWGQIKPQIAEAFGQKFDEAVLWDLDKPAGWDDGILAQCVAKNKTADLSTIVAANGDLYDAILGESGVFGMVEGGGYGVTGSVAHLSMKAKLRGLRGEDGHPIFKASEGVQGSSNYALDGQPMYFVENSPTNDALLLVGDWRKLVWAYRQQITWKVLDQAVIQDSSGTIIHNFAQEDKVGLRCVVRIGWALPNPPNRVSEDDANAFPFAALVA